MKSIVYIGVSLDGYIAREDGNIDWLGRFANAEVFQAYQEFIKPIDAILIGRGTFEKVLSFPSWPYQLPVYVLSSTITEVPPALKGKMELVNQRPANVLQFLEEKGHQHVYIDGGKLIQGFLADDLVDEMIISFLPILIGKGIPLFGALSTDLVFELVSTKSFSNGIVSNHYRRMTDTVKGS